MVAVTLFAAAGGVFWVAVWTSAGQRIDQWLFDGARNLSGLPSVPDALQVAVVSNPLLWIGLGAVVIVLVQVARQRRRRPPLRSITMTAALLLFPPLAILGARILRDDVLVRPRLHDWITQTANSAPSGHAAALTAAIVILVLAVPPVFRPWVAVLAAGWAVVVDFGLMTAGWHRPSDVVISTLLVVGAGVLLPDPWRATRRPAAAVYQLSPPEQAMPTFATERHRELSYSA